MNFCSIAAAMVQNTQSSLYEAGISNRRHSEDLVGAEGLLPVWNVVPDFGATQRSNEVQVADAVAAGVRAVTLFPKTNGWAFYSSEAKDLIAKYTEAGIVLYLDVSQLENWRELNELFSIHPATKVILTGAKYDAARQTISALQAFPNLHITMERFQIHYGIEHLCAMGLADQLLFGTNAPEASAGAHRTPIDYADVPEATRAAIAGGNLMRLLGDIPVPREVENSEEDVLMASARKGQALEVPLLDLHMHVLDEGLDCAGTNLLMPRGGPTGMYDLHRKLGYQGGGFMSWNGVYCNDVANGNRCVQAALDASPGGYWGLATVDPSHYTQSGMQDSLQAIYSDPRFIGMKPYRFFGYTYEEKPYWQWWEFGQERGLYGLIHLNKMDFSEADFLASNYPGVHWMIPHCGESFWFAEKAVERAQRFPNVFLEITFTSCCGGIIEYLAEHAGANRVIYGSDAPMRDPRQQLGWVVYSRLDPATKMRILAESGLSMIRHLLPQLPTECRPQLSNQKSILQ
jgi:predicted TIM-barrel fold metal-dependent hydrolase